MGLDRWPGGSVPSAAQASCSELSRILSKPRKTESSTLARELQRQCLSLLGISLKTIQNNQFSRNIVGIAKAATVLSKRSWIWQLALAISR